MLTSDTASFSSCMTMRSSQPAECMSLIGESAAGGSAAAAGCSSAELVPPSIIAFAETLKDQLCKAGHCPAYLVFKDHSHISEVMSPNTADDSVTGPILKWITSVK